MPENANDADPFSSEEWDAHCRRVVREMASHASRYSTPISLSMNADRTGKHLGTGSYHDLFGFKVLLTCEHVLKFHADNRLAHKLRDHDRYVLLGEVGWPIDAGVASITGWDAVRHGSEALPLVRMDMVHTPMTHELLFIHGYASENAQFVYDELRTDGTAYLGRQAALPENENLNLRFHFGIEYRRDAAILAFGERGLPNPHSMSGSLVWNTRFVECALDKKDWTPEEAVVTGLLWSWPDEHHVVATRIEYVRSFLLSALDQWRVAEAAEAQAQSGASS
jgi:hypothetical protein